MDYELSLDGCPTLGVEVEVTERLHSPWVALVRVAPLAASTAAELPPEQLVREWLGRRGTLGLRPEIAQDCELPAPVKQGIVRAVHLTRAALELEFVAPLALLGLGQDQRIFLELDALEIASQIFQEATIRVENRCGRALAKRRQCVQHWESRLTFVSRILAEEGIVYHCAADGSNAVVLLDSPDAFDGDPAPLLVRREAGLTTSSRAVNDARLRYRRRTESVLLNEWNYEAPSADLASPAGDKSALEYYQFHADYKDTEQGKQLAQLTLESLRQDTRVLQGSTPCRELVPGRSVEVEADESGLRGRWLVTSVSYVSQITSDASPATGGEQRFVCEFQAVPGEAGFRPKQQTVPSEFITSSLVAGADGDEIHPDDQLRVKLRQHADRRGADGDRDAASPPKDTDSTWCRVVQPNMSGSMLIPRVGWEVICGHWGKGSDEPLVLGRMVNALFPPPNPLPAQKTFTAFGTRSTPAGGGKGNRVAFDDTKGKEGMHFNAGSDLTDKTANDKTTTVTASESHNVSGSRNVATAQVYTKSTLGAETYSVGTRNVKVASNKTINAGAETIVIGGARIFCVGGEQGIEAATLVRCVAGLKTELPVGGEARKVKGSNVTVIGGALLQAASTSGVSVAGVNNEAVAGPKVVSCTNYALNVTGVLTESYGARLIRGAGVDHIGKGAININNSGAATLSGANVVFQASGKITIKAGGCTISITPGSVEVDGNFESSGEASNSASQKYG
ncbi:MAG: type VI secretion system tip protein VgrG [Polyangiaceae bacterium]|nr:type VI secretion system tip protein VgrG [Polyangiaceae bacterium]MCB9608956.1 type VI secretion system tip protein VgrG [Polyangiaceae bacterium]